MGLLGTILRALSSGGGIIEIREYPSIYSDYNLCSLALEALVTPLSSSYVLSIGTIRLTANPPTAPNSLCSQADSFNVASPSSAYDLSSVPL